MRGCIVSLILVMFPVYAFGHDIAGVTLPETLMGNEEVELRLNGAGIRYKLKGIIQGKDFNDALLLIWLDKAPVNSDLKDKLIVFNP